MPASYPFSIEPFSRFGGIRAMSVLQFFNNSILERQHPLVRPLKFDIGKGPATEKYMPGKLPENRKPQDGTSDFKQKLTFNHRN